MDYRRVRTGDDIEIKADTWNSFLAAAEYTQKQQKFNGQISGNSDSCLVKVQNVSGSAMAQYAAVAVTGVISEPNNSNVNAGSTIEFNSNLVLKVAVPTTADAGRWLVLLEPVANNAIGWAIGIGVTQCWINLTNTSHTCVEITNGSVVPVSGTSGNRILWVKGGVGAATATGNQYAVIRICEDYSGETFPARITAVSGSFPTWSYTVQRVLSYDATQTGAARWVTDGVNITGVLNRCEFQGTPTYTYGTGNSITASDGTVNSGSCKVISIGIGSVVDIRGMTNNSGTVTYSFYAANSAQ